MDYQILITVVVLAIVLLLIALIIAFTKQQKLIKNELQRMYSENNNLHDKLNEYRLKEIERLNRSESRLWDKSCRDSDIIRKLEEDLKVERARYLQIAFKKNYNEKEAEDTLNISAR